MHERFLAYLIYKQVLAYEIHYVKLNWIDGVRKNFCLALTTKCDSKIKRKDLPLCRPNFAPGTADMRFALQMH